MARRRSKWRRTSQMIKKMMQEARNVRARESLRQCPVCGSPHSLVIEVKVDKETDRKSAEVYCTACGFSHVFPEIPMIADEFWVYSKTLDIVHGTSTPRATATESETTAEVQEPAGEAVGSEAGEEPKIEFEEEYAEEL